MAKLYFKVGSDWDEVVRLRNEIEKLKSTLKGMDSTQSPIAFKTLNTQLLASTQQMDGLVTNAAKAGAVMEGDFKNKIFTASQSVNGFTERIIAQKAVVKDVEADVKRLGEAYRIALRRSPLSANNKFADYSSAKKTLDEEKAALFGLTQEQANARLSVRKLRDEYTLYKNDGKQVVETNKGIGLSLGKALGVIGGVTALKRLGSEIIRVRGEFQSMQTAIETLVGKDMAGKLIPQIKELAKVSPLTLSDMVGSEKMMLGFNIKAEDTIRYLQALGDISMGNSQKFNSLTLAFSQMSAAGKLMGQDLNQMINAGFNPLQTISEKTGKSIATLKEEMSKGAVSAEMVQRAFIDATSEGGKFYKMSENASKTINGQISMMQDALDAAFNEMGQASEGVIMSGIQATTSLIQNYETIGKILAGLVVTYGTYRTAVMLVTAAESKHTLVEIGLTNVRILARKAQLALNASMLTNPYVALAVIIGGLVTTMWAFHDSTTAAEKAQKQLNKEHEEAAQRKQELTSKTDSLISKIDSETESVYSQVKAYKELINLFPELGNMSFEEFKNLPQDRQKKIFSNISEKREEQDAIEAYEADLKKIEELKKQIKEVGEEVTYSQTSSNVNKLDGLRKELEVTNNLSKLHKEDLERIRDLQWEANTPVEEKVKHYEDAKKRLVEERSELEKTLTKSEDIAAAWIVVPDIINGIKLDALNKQIKETEGKISSLTGNEKNSVKNKSYWVKKKQEAETARDALSVEDQNSKDWNKYSLRIKEAQKNIDKYSNSKTTKQENQAEKIREQQDKYKLMLEKQALDRQRQRQDLDNQAEQVEIDALKDGFDKKERQRNLNNKKEIQDLERQKEDYINIVIQSEKELFDAQEELKARRNSKYNKKTFDPSSVSVDTSAFDAMINNTPSKQLNDRIREQEDSWNEYLIKFGSYQQKRKALIEKYDKEIVEAKTAGEAAILEKEKNNYLDDLDNSVKNSATLMGQLFADASKKSSNEIQKIIEKAELLMKYLGSVKDEQGNARIGGKSISKRDIFNLGISENTLQNLELSTEEVEALRNAIDKLKGDLGSKSPFMLFKDQVKSAVDKISQGGKKNIAQGITEIGEAAMSFAPAISRVGQDISNIIGDDDLGNKISGVSDALSGLGQTAAGVGQIMSGDIVGGAISAVSGISSIVSAFEGLFGANYDKYNKAKEEYESYISVLDDVIEKQKEMVASLDTQNAVNTYDYAKSLIDKSAEAARILGKERLNSGASAGSHSIGVRIQKGMSDKEWDDVRRALGEDFDKATEGRMTGLFDLSVEQLEKLQDEAPTFWAKLDDDVRTYLEDIIAANESAEDLRDTLNESLTGISFDSLFDNFLESLYDMESSAEDISDDMADYLRKSLIKSFAVENYKGEMKKWYEKWADAMKDGEITPEERKSLDDLKNSIITGATESAKLINDQFGYLKDDNSSQSSSKGSFQSMSQDTGDELNGRFTALQMAGEELKNQNILQSKSLDILNVKAESMLLINTEAKNIVNEIRTIQVNSFLQLQEIRENTGAIIKPIKNMAADIAEVKKNTSKL